MRTRELIHSILLIIALLSPGAWARQAGESPGQGQEDPEVTALADEVRGKGWVLHSARSDHGDWDLFLMRPDGSNGRHVTNTVELNEAAARVSPDGQKILYYRMPKDIAVDNNKYGTYELIVANADGTEPVVWGKQFPWASWGPDGKRLACLVPSGIRIVDVATTEIIRTMARKGIVQQLVWSPDGQCFAGTANGLGPYWTIGRIDAVTGLINAASEVDRYNCTPDWFPDSRHIIYARGIIPEAGGYAQLWAARADGKEARLLYAEQGRHIYGGATSPDGRYLLFTRSERDLGQVDNSRTTMAIMRLQDAPVLIGENEDLRKRYPHAGDGPVLYLSNGWEPHWTYAEIDGKK